MTLDYIRLPVSILQIEDLSFAQKLILALIISLKKGLKLSNAEIGRLLGISASQVSSGISDMGRKRYIRIENGRSKYRKIYFTENPQVGDILLNGFPESKSVLLNGFPEITSRKTRNITKGTNKERTYKARKDPCGNNGTFDRFWAAYPKKREKGKAREAWKKLKPTQELTERILAAVEQHRQSADWIKDGGKYIPYPAKWLKAEQWEDEIGGNGELTHDASEEEIAMLEREGILT